MRRLRPTQRATALDRRDRLGARRSVGDPLRRVREVIDGLLGDRDRPVVVGVDDAHLLDDQSAFAVHQLVTRGLATVILTLRSDQSAGRDHRDLERPTPATG